MSKVNQYNMDIFAVPISVTNFGEESRDLNKQLLYDCERIYEDEQTEQRTGIGVHQSKTGLETKYDSFQRLQKIISSASKDTVQRGGTQSSNVQATGFWININTDPCAYNMPHSHSFSYMWTGVYFPTSGFDNNHEISSDQDLDEFTEILSSSKPNPGSLVLLDPNEHTKSGIADRNTSRYPYWGNPICITPREGTLVIFPSYLPHMVTPTCKDHFKRISIAFMVEI